jgi:hypothetical protein
MPLNPVSRADRKGKAMFVLYRKGYEICGVGESPEAAREDAAEWLDGGRKEAETATLMEEDGGFFGGLYISPCTDRLVTALVEDKEELVFDWNEEGVMDLVEGESLDD